MHEKIMLFFICNTPNSIFFAVKELISNGQEE